MKKIILIYIIMGLFGCSTTKQVEKLFSEAQTLKNFN